MNRTEALSVLGLSADASRDEITRAYRELAQMLHPDKYGDNKKLRTRAEQQMRSINQARDVLLKGSDRTRGAAAARRTSSSRTTPEAIAYEAQIRANAAETARIAIVTQLRTLRERRSGIRNLTIAAAVVLLICSRLRGTVGALGFSISSMLVAWGCVDLFTYSNQIGTLAKRQLELIEVRDAAQRIADEAREL